MEEFERSKPRHDEGLDPPGQYHLWSMTGQGQDCSRAHCNYFADFQPWSRAAGRFSGRAPGQPIDVYNELYESKDSHSMLEMSMAFKMGRGKGQRQFDEVRIQGRESCSLELGNAGRELEGNLGDHEYAKMFQSERAAKMAEDKLRKEAGLPPNEPEQAPAEAVSKLDATMKKLAQEVADARPMSRPAPSSAGGMARGSSAPALALVGCGLSPAARSVSGLRTGPGARPGSARQANPRAGLAASAPTSRAGSRPGSARPARPSSAGSQRASLEGAQIQVGEPPEQPGAAPGGPTARPSTPQRSQAASPSRSRPATPGRPTSGFAPPSRARGSGHPGTPQRARKRPAASHLTGLNVQGESLQPAQGREHFGHFYSKESVECLVKKVQRDRIRDRNLQRQTPEARAAAAALRDRAMLRHNDMKPVSLVKLHGMTKKPALSTGAPSLTGDLRRRSTSAERGSAPALGVGQAEVSVRSASPMPRVRHARVTKRCSPA